MKSGGHNAMPDRCIFQSLTTRSNQGQVKNFEGIYHEKQTKTNHLGINFPSSLAIYCSYIPINPLFWNIILGSALYTTM